MLAWLTDRLKMIGIDSTRANLVVQHTFVPCAEIPYSKDTKNNCTWKLFIKKVNIVLVSGIGRNGMLTANLRYRFFCTIHFRDYSRTIIENFRSKFAREPTYFQEFLDPTKKRKRNLGGCHIIYGVLHKFHTGPSPTALLGTAASIHFVYEICRRQLQQLSKLGVTMHYSKLSTSSFRLFVLEIL